MRKLYHFPICPLSRQIRVVLKELNLAFSIVKQEYSSNGSDFSNPNRVGILPVLEENSQLIVPGIYPIIEYLNEEYPNFHLMSNDIISKVEIRRLFWWLNDKFHKEVTQSLIDEKIIRLATGVRMPQTENIRAARSSLLKHLIYFNNLLENRSFLASDHLTIADIAAACHISVLDYFGEINWSDWSLIHTWYAILKSRPSFRPILQDQIPGFIPSRSYADLDF